MQQKIKKIENSANPFLSNLAHVSSVIMSEIEPPKKEIKFRLRDEKEIADYRLRKKKEEEEIGEFRKRNQKIKIFYYSSGVILLEFRRIGRKLNNLGKQETIDLQNFIEEDSKDLSPLIEEIKNVFPVNVNRYEGIQLDEFVENFREDLIRFKKSLLTSLLYASLLFSGNEEFEKGFDLEKIKKENIQNLAKILKRKEVFNFFGVVENFERSVIEDFEEPKIFFSFLSGERERILECKNQKVMLELFSIYLKSSFNLYGILAKNFGLLETYMIL